MSCRRPSLVAGALLLIGCLAGRGAVFVTVETTPGTRLVGVASLRVVVENNSVRSTPATIAISEGVVSLPPERSFQLRFDRERSGSATVTVEALGATGQLLAMGVATTKLEPGREVAVRVLLPGTPIGDGGVVDLVTPPDLTGCTLAPSLATDGGVLLHVREGATSDAGTPSSPFGTVKAAVAAAQALNVPATVLIEAGAYNESVTVGGAIALRGGYHQDYVCRDPLPHPSTITSVVDDLPAVAIAPSMGGEVLLDGLTLVGKSAGAIGSVGLTVDGPAKPTVDDCEILGHANLTNPIINASVAARVVGATPLFRRSTLRSGAANVFLNGLMLCDSKAVLVDSLVEANTNFGTNERHIGIGNIFCASNVSFDVTLTRSRVITSGSTSAVESRAIQVLSSQPSVITLEGSALVCEGKCDNIVFTDGSASTLVAKASTLWANPNTSYHGLFGVTPMSVELADSIIVALVPLGNVSVLNKDMRTRNNIFFGQVPNIIKEYNSVMSDLMQYRIISGDQTSVFVDPELLDTDHHHLKPTSPAINKASGCDWVTTDIDGNPRPLAVSTKCDIGADEAQ